MRLSKFVVFLIAVFLLALPVDAGLAGATPPQTTQATVNPAIRQQKGLAYVDKNTRRSYLERATLWQRVDIDQADARAGRQIVDAHGSGIILPNDSTVECRYVQETAGGTTDKFHCEFIRATDSSNIPITINLKKLKVRYDSVKTVSDVVVTRLAWILGFGSEIETPVLKLICHGCSSDPFHQKAPVQGEQIFSRVTVETSLSDGDGIYVEGTRYAKDDDKDESAWYWDELKFITDPERKAQSDALKLFAVFLKHGDSKAIQNDLICLTDIDAKGICNDPFLYVKDFGNTLGSDGLSVHPLDFQKWSTAPMWSDTYHCIGSLRMNSGNGSGLSDPEISEAGRKFLADLLANLIRHESKLRDIFDVAHIQEYDDHGHKHSVDDWVKAFETRAALIVDHAACQK